MGHRDLRSFFVHLLCFALLLQGPPLMALEHAGVEGWSEPEWLDELSWPSTPDAGAV